MRDRHIVRGLKLYFKHHSLNNSHYMTWCHTYNSRSVQSVMDKWRLIDIKTEPYHFGLIDIDTLSQDSKFGIKVKLLRSIYNPICIVWINQLCFLAIFVY